MQIVAPTAPTTVSITAAPTSVSTQEQIHDKLQVSTIYTHVQMHMQGSLHPARKPIQIQTSPALAALTVPAAAAAPRPAAPVPAAPLPVRAPALQPRAVASSTVAVRHPCTSP